MSGLAKQGPPATAPDRWFLSFDCATKSFAWALLRIRTVGADLLGEAESLAAAVAANDAAAARVSVRALDKGTRECLHLAAGGAVDLVPGKKDQDIHSVERVRAAVAYLRETVDAAVAGAEGCPPVDSARLNVAIEYQMGPNTRARTISVVLLTHFADANIFLVGPSYKNKLHYAARPDLRHCYFVERYSSLYTANKNHSKELYLDHIAKIFGHDAEPPLQKIPTRLYKDFADCVLQVLGLLAFGDLDNAAEKF